MINILSNYYPIKESDLPKNLPLSVRYIKLIGVSPGTFLIVGLILFAISFGRIFVRTIERTTREKNVKDDHVNATSIKIASDWIRKIKFQQTFTSGWSGGLKLPIGLEGGINRAYSFAENQLSIPEIVTGFVDFISSIPKEYLIIIGIDEMDKIDSDEHAQAFLNELKSIFGLPRCFFLVSVSENAMSSFERRGLPFRDVFDSSFDHIIYVEYLTLENAKALLQRRVIGKPIPFFCLSYCLSGGLPRDLIRNFREIVKISKSNLVNKDISSVCEQLLKDEYSSKIRAVTFSAKKVQSLREADEFFSILNTLATSSLSSEFVKRSLNTLKSWKVSITPKVETENEIHKSYQILFDLCEELCTYTYFIDTVLQLFTNNFDRDKFDEIYSTHGFERLAQARQALSVDMSVANWVINEMRANYQMEAFHR